MHGRDGTKRQPCYGSSETIEQTAAEVLAHAPERFVLAADCTLPSETPWQNLKTAIKTAHHYRKQWISSVGK